MTGLQGGKFWNGFAAGSLSSIASSTVQGIGNSGANDSNWNCTVADRNPDFMTGAIIASGTISGGVGASLSGGNFWQGAVTGLFVSTFNHAMSHGDPPGGKKGKYYNKKPAYNSDNLLQEHYDDAITLSEWSKINDGLTREQIISSSQNQSKTTLNSQLGGPQNRYVFHPKTGNVIDMRHMLIMGNNDVIVGNMVEVAQKMGGLQSGLNMQDFYSNSLGYEFYNNYNSIIAQLGRSFGVGTNFSREINNYLNR